MNTNKINFGEAITDFDIWFEVHKDELSQLKLENYSDFFHPYTVRGESLNNNLKDYLFNFSSSFGHTTFAFNKKVIECSITTTEKPMDEISFGYSYISMADAFKKAILNI